MKILLYLALFVLAVVVISFTISNIRTRNKIPELNKEITALRDSIEDSERTLDSLFSEVKRRDTITMVRVARIRDKGRILVNGLKPVNIDSIANEADTEDINKIKHQLLNDSI